MSRHDENCPRCAVTLYVIAGVPPIACLVEMADLPEELKLTASQLAAMCLSEAGYPVELIVLPATRAHRYSRSDIPDDMYLKARLMACDHLGIPHPEPQYRKVV